METQRKSTVLTGQIAVTLGIFGILAALVSGVLFTFQIVNPGCGSIDSGFPVPWIQTPQGCPPNWPSGTVYAWPFLALDALFYMGIGYAILIIYTRRMKHAVSNSLRVKSVPRTSQPSWSVKDLEHGVPGIGGDCDSHPERDSCF
jgi:hypothetical protein